MKNTVTPKIKMSENPVIDLFSPFTSGLMEYDRFNELAGKILHNLDDENETVRYNSLGTIFGLIAKGLRKYNTEATEKRRIEIAEKKRIEKLKEIKTCARLSEFLQKHHNLATEAFKHHADKYDVEWLRVIASHVNILDLLVKGENIGWCSNVSAEGHLDVIRFLLNEVPDFDLNEKYMGEYAMIHSACEKGNIEIVEELITNGADPSILSLSGLRPSCFAVSGNHIAIIDRLYLAGASFKGCLYDVEEVTVDTIIHLLDMDVLRGKDLYRIIEKGEAFFIEVYTRLYTSEKKRAYSLLEGSLEETRKLIEKNAKYIEIDEGRAVLRHFVLQCVVTDDEDERKLLRTILLPHITSWLIPPAETGEDEDEDEDEEDDGEDDEEDEEEDDQ